ncbi:spore germination protein [Brevibacillus fluminis]|uniref:Spore germination protein n=2 Tax=Brevibacillus fluminis TaxID=511487 RepID=A0A3M8DRN4_9BACL|nr:spore germination protein [Brevibacillus fluminis]
MIMERIGQNFDVVLREFRIGGSGARAAIIYISDLADVEKVHEDVLKPLMLVGSGLSGGTGSGVEVGAVVTVGEITEANSLEVCLDNILRGETVLIIDGRSGAFILGTRYWESRNIEQPISETVVRGPRDGFIETLSTNISLLRRRINNPAFTMVKLRLGERTQKEVVVAYMDGIANQKLVQTVLARVGKINLDDVPESGFIEQFIEDNHFSPFPQVMNTERPDKVVAALMEGRVAILLDGTPFVLLAPVTFWMLLQSPEDYYERWMIGTLLRMLRFISTVMALFLPSIYVALTSYHQGLIPTRLAISIASSREGVPFPTLIEALIMEATIELLREAGIRLPKVVGQAVGIVGGLVIGQSAVQAGIVSPIMLIVVAVTAICSFTLPHYGVAISIRMLRFGMMFAASVMGLYGIMLAFLLLCAHLCKLKSFGVNYTAPYVHTNWRDMKDNIIRAPLQLFKLRPRFLRPKDDLRSKS